MRELTTFEIEEVAGGLFDLPDLGSAVAGAITGGIAAGWAGAIIGGRHGGDGGGILGFGIIGQGVGMLAGGLFGLVGGVVGGALVGYDKVMELADEAMKSLPYAA